MSRTNLESVYIYNIVIILELPRIQGNGKMCFSQVSLNKELHII